MIKIFYGENRVKIGEEVRRIFGAEYEVIEGEGMDAGGLRDALLGQSFLAPERKVLIKGIGENKTMWESLIGILGEEGGQKVLAGSGNWVLIWEEKMDKRIKSYKDLVKMGVEMKEFKIVNREAEQNARLVFEILDTAMRDGRRAVLMVEKIEMNQDPYMMVGLFTTQAIKKYEMRQGEREKELLKRLAKLDLAMKEVGVEPWLLVKGFLLEIERRSLKNSP